MNQEHARRYEYYIVSPEEDGMGTVSSKCEPQQNVPETVGADGNPDEAPAKTPLAGVRGIGSALPHEISNQQEKEVCEDRRDIRDAQRLDIERWALGVGGVGLLALLFTLYMTMEQARIARETFQATRRAIVHLAVREGKVGDFLLEDDALRIVLYFSNSGPTAAQRTIIDVWPITTVPDHPPIVTTFPPPDDHYLGPNIPPGFPHTMYRSYRDATKEELDRGEKNLQIVGRVIYRDVFARYCETFTLRYDGTPFGKFSLGIDSPPDLCDGKEHYMKSSLIMVKPGPAGTQVYPFPEAPPSGTKNNP